MRSAFDPAALGDHFAAGDLAWVARTLGLPDDAFHGPAGDDARLAVMRAGGTIDVAACPGSGKTTLLVGKLAILARAWTHAGQGICVLSHTNVAREEIERRLSGDASGRSLLGYPHFVGTIHAFVNSFVALPWLRSQNMRVAMIDDEHCYARRWAELDYGAKYALEQKRKSAKDLKIVDTEFGLGDISWRKGTPLDRTTKTYLAMVEACRAAAANGYFCHGDMFLWAHQALDRNPSLAAAIRHRFPILFLDEVQDNDDEQAELLHRIFMAGEDPVLRQRFGDMNQAIYGDSDGTGGARDIFPDPQGFISVPNSHRFGQAIASAADPVALSPPGLIGLRATRPDKSPLALLLFEPPRAFEVIPAFADLLTKHFTADELRKGDFAAIGSVQRDKGAENAPNCVAHYWADYDHLNAAREAKPRHFLQYVMKGDAERGSRNDIYPVVERVGEAMLRLASILMPSIASRAVANRHRQVLALLEHDEKMLSDYRRLVLALATGRGPPGADDWENRWRKPILKIARAIGGNMGGDDPGDFLDWVDTAAPQPGRKRRDNVYSHPPDAPQVRIRIGTIHSVKGETHRATLVLDTHYSGSHLLRIKPWLIGKSRGLSLTPPRVTVRKSLKQHYVAMTRPSDLLCIAMRVEDVSDEELARFRERNWSIGDVRDALIHWR